MVLLCYYETCLWELSNIYHGPQSMSHFASKLFNFKFVLSCTYHQKYAVPCEVYSYEFTCCRCAHNSKTECTCDQVSRSVMQPGLLSSFNMLESAFPAFQFSGDSHHFLFCSFGYHRFPHWFDSSCCFSLPCTCVFAA